MIHLFQSFLLIILVCTSLHHVHGQVSVTQQTAGIDPNTQNPTFSAGLNGLSTGSTVVFTALGTGPSPSISRQTVTLTGAELSQYQASIASAAAQASGSNFAYTSTTGNQIPGIAATLSGGYNDPEERPNSQVTVTASARQGSSGNTAGLSIFVKKSDFYLKAFLITGLSVFVATLML